MKKIILLIAIATTIIACGEKDQKVVGKNDKGEDLVLNEKGDTIVAPKKDSIATEKTTENPENTDLAVLKQADGTYSFKYNLKKDQVYPFTLVLTDNKKMSDGKKTLTVVSSNTKKVEYKVLSEDKDGFTLLVTFREYAESAKDDKGQTIGYSTSKTKPADQNVAMSWTIYKSLIGQSYTMKIKNNGEVISISGLDKVRAHMESQLKSSLSAEEQKGFSQFLQAQLNNEAMKAQFEQTMKILPKKNVKIGESWSDSQKLNEGKLTGNSNVTNTFKSINDQSAQIAINGTQNLSSNQSDQGMTLKENANGTLKGTITIDIKSGWLNQVTLDKSETVKRTLEGNGQKETMSETTHTITKLN